MPAGVEEAAASRSVEDWLEIIPQDVAANIGVAKPVGETVLIACKQGSTAEVGNLTDREYMIVLLLAQSMGYDEIGDELGIARPTVRTHIHNAYGKLNVRSQEEAGGFIPIEEEQLRRRAVWAMNDLIPRHREVMDLVRAGLHNKQIAFKLGLKDSTVRTHKANICQLLGIGDGVELQRLSGAMANLERYASVIGITAHILQPLVLDAIAAKGPESACQPDLAGLVSDELLVNRPWARWLMRVGLSSTVSHTLIQAETAHYWHKERA
jgi:DNA-binding NarL/FixJ family response regulator